LNQRCMCLALTTIEVVARGNGVEEICSN
jgi:hypothetical protein